MTDKQELPALPLWSRLAATHIHYDADQMRAYAQAALTAQAAEVARLTAEVEANAKLARFGAWCAREFRDSLSDVDGGSAQDAMERFGVIVKAEVTEPCGEGCVCVEYGEFPHDCYKFPTEIDAAMKEQTNE